MPRSRLRDHASLRVCPVWLIAGLIVSLLSLAPTLAPTASGATLPPGFSDRLVASIPKPTALAATPDGRLLITTQTGKLYVYRDGALIGAPALDLGSRICSNWERGVLGVAVHPNFATNRLMYLFYTFNKHNACPTGGSTDPNKPVNRASRFTLNDDNTVDLSSERILIDNIPSPAGNHNGGDMHFGKDGHLYISVGDGGCDYADITKCAGNNDAARDRHVLLGKILRITADGGIPPDNPFLGSDSARCNTTGITDPGKHCRETFAWGLRNPFRLAFDPNAAGTRFFINDVGQDAWEEINEGRAGADYGWNEREGFCVRNSATDCGSPPSGMTNPIFAYNHDATGCRSITGGAFVPAGVWPDAFEGAYLYSDYICGKIFRLTPTSGGGYNSTEFVTGLGSSSAVAMIFASSETGMSLYYTSYANGGEVRRIDIKQLRRVWLPMISQARTQ